MTDKKTHRKQENHLRKRAENSLEGKAALIPKTPEKQLPGEVLRLYNELQVHQIELVMQNDELCRTQKELEHSRERYFDLYDLAPVGYVTLSETGLILEANLTAAKILGLVRSVLVNQPLTRFILPEDQNIYYHSHRLLLETGTLQVCEIRMLSQSKLPFWCQIEATMSENAEGSSVYRAVISDISERKKLEEVLRESEELFRLTFDKSPIGAAMVDIDQRITRANREFCRMLDYSEEEIIGTALRDITHPDDIGAELDNLRIMLNGKLDHFTMEKRYICKSGNIVWGQLTAGVIRDSCGRPKYAVRMIEDITDRKQTENILKERTLQLEEVNRELESFSYSVSHDLRAPLRAIDGFSRMILKKQGNQFDDDTRNKFAVIQNNTRVMNQLIDDLLAFSRMGKQDMTMTKLDMGDLFADVWAELKLANTERNMVLSVGSMPPVRGDRKLLKQVIINLLSNAVKFTKNLDGAFIEVGTIASENEVVFYVKDNGVGFDMEYQNKLFGVFQRLHSAEEFEGTGVGLAIVQRIIQRHGGHVWAEGKVDQGATFYFSLPSTSQNNTIS